MATNYKVNKVGKLNFLLSIILAVFAMNFSFSQEHVHTASCVSSHEVSCTKDVKAAFEKLEKNTAFKTDFRNRFQIDFSAFMQLNSYEKQKFINYLVNEVCFKNRSTNELGTIFIELIAKTKDNYWFEKPVITDNSKMEQVSKGIFIPKKEPNADNAPKTAACLNADFEMGDYTGWTAFCGTVTGATMGGTTSEGTACGGQHAIVSGGTDAYTGSPRVFQGGNSAMLGDGTGTGSRYARLRKTFVVAASNPAITYSYMAVLQDPGTGHTNPQRPFFSARVFVGGSEVSCAQYFSYFGDGAPGWVTGGGVAYRDWTSVFVPLESYIGQTITLEITVGDCSQSGHWGYAYVDVTCENMEVEQFCEGSSTVLSAPSEGIQAYQWSTGETTQQITITTPGTYTVNILPIGSICSATLTYNASIYPAPTASFTTDYNSICVGGSVNFTNTSVVDPGGTITGYQWNFGDGVVTPSSTGTISGVPQTTGTYTDPNHVYNAVGSGNVILTIQTADGCSATAQIPISVIQGPEATIGGNDVVCSGDTPPEITFTGSQTPPPFTFTYNINGGAAQTVTTSSGNSVTVPVPTATPGSYTYNLTHVSSSSSAMCEQDQTGSVTIVVNPIPNATIATDATVCQNAAAPVITFTGSNGTSNYQFTYSLNGGASQTISTSGTNTATINVPTATPGTFQYTLLAVEDISTGCSQTFTGSGHSSTVIVNPLPDADIAGTVVVCQNDAQPVITFTGTGSSGNYTFSYNINGGSSQTITTTGGSNQATVNAPTNVPGTYIYELLNVSDPATGCNQNINETQTITVNPLPAATIYGSTTVCQYSAQPQITFTGDYGTSDYEFTYSINGGVNQTVMTSGSPSVTVNVPTSVGGTYVYQLISVMDVTTGCFQAQTGTATVVVNLMPTATIAGTVTVCQDATAPVITFTGQNSSDEYAFSYNINGGPTQTVTTSGSNIATVTQSTAVPGTYVYTLTNVMDPASLCNQDLNLTETITVNPLPVASISAPVEACHMDAVLPEVVFTGSVGTAPYTFAYNINGGATQFATSTGSTVTFPVSTGTTGTFIYTITNIQEGSTLGCQQTQNVSTIATIHALPNVSAGNDFSVCAAVPIVLTGSGAQTYQWDNGVVNGVPFTPTDTTTYTVIGTDHNGCRNTDQITVSVVPIPVMDIDGINLYGCNPVIPTFTNNSTGNLTNCTWYLGNGEVLQGCGSVSSVFNVPGCFDVTLVVSTPEGCTNSLTINNYVCVEANPVADFYPKPAELTTYDWETQMINESSGATSYYWDFGDGTAPSYEHSPYHEYPNDFAGVYQVMLVASTPAGCVDTAYATVTLKEELLFYVPNTFTPDGDDYNETFKPIFTTGFDPYNYTLLIFNRWGEIIFESHDTNVGWNGKYGVDGKLCQDGTYTWKIDVKGRTSSQQSQFTGHVNLIR